MEFFFFVEHGMLKSWKVGTGKKNLNMLKKVLKFINYIEWESSPILAQTREEKRKKLLLLPNKVYDPLGLGWFPNHYLANFVFCIFW